MAVQVARYLDIRTTQGGADTFDEGSVSTEILPENGLAFAIRAIELSFLSGLAAVSADWEILWSMSRDTKTAACAPTDPDCMLYDGRSGSLTTSGTFLNTRRVHYDALPGIFIVEPTIYAQLSSAATGITLDANFRIWYEEIKLSEVEILRVLNNR